MQQYRSDANMQNFKTLTEFHHTCKLTLYTQNINLLAARQKGLSTCIHQKHTLEINAFVVLNTSKEQNYKCIEYVFFLFFLI